MTHSNHIAIVLRRTLLCVSFAAAVSPLGAQQRVTLATADTRLAGTTRTQFVVGSEEGAEWQMLSNVMQVAFDAKGNLYILDAGNFRVTVMDPAGRRVRTFGRKGGGPGELMAPTGLTVASDGSIVVADLGRSAFSVFRPDGTFRYNVPYPTDLGSPSISGGTGSPGVIMNPKGGVFVLGALRLAVGTRGEAPPAPPTDWPLYTLPLVEKNPAARVLYRVPRPAPQVTQGGSSTERSFRMHMKEFTPAAMWDVLPDGGVAVQSGADYAVHIIDAAGKPVRVLTRPIKPRTTTRRDMDAARERRAAAMRAGTGIVRMSVQNGPGGMQRSVGAGEPADEQQVQETLRSMEFEPVIPVAQRLAVTPRGRVWLQRQAAVWGERGPIDVIDPAGRYVGTIAPQAFPNAFSTDGRAAYIERDDDGVEKVVVRHLPQAWM